MNGMNFSPPAPPSAPVLEQLHALLVVLSNPALVQAHLDALEEAHAANLASTAELALERDRLTNAQAREADLKEREQALARVAASQERAAMQLANAAAAVADREQKVSALEAAAAARTEDLDKREKALSDRLETYRKALA
jgi:hypothetical protein